MTGDQFDSHFEGQQEHMSELLNIAYSQLPTWECKFPAEFHTAEITKVQRLEISDTIGGEEVQIVTA